MAAPCAAQDPEAQCGYAICTYLLAHPVTPSHEPSEYSTLKRVSILV